MTLEDLRIQELLQTEVQLGLDFHRFWAVCRPSSARHLLRVHNNARFTDSLRLTIPGEITAILQLCWCFAGMFLLDDEGELSTTEVQAKFVNGKPDRIEAKYIMKSQFQWERFMRFMERYAEDKQLGFTGKVNLIQLSDAVPDIF